MLPAWTCTSRHPAPHLIPASRITDHDHLRGKTSACSTRSRVGQRHGARGRRGGIVVGGARGLADDGRLRRSGDVGRQRNTAWRPNGGVRGRGATPLHIAALLNNVDLSMALVAAGADPWRKDAKAWLDGRDLAIAQAQLGSIGSSLADMAGVTPEDVDRLSGLKLLQRRRLVALNWYVGRRAQEHPPYRQRTPLESLSYTPA